MLSLTSCAMSTDEIATYLTSINSSYQNGAYEQAQTEIEKLNKSTKNMTEEQKSKYEELQPLIEYATQKSGEINNALNDAQSLCDQKMYYEANQALDKISTDYKLPPTEQKKFDEEKTTAENGIKSVKITDALKNVETIYNGGDRGTFKDRHVKSYRRTKSKISVIADEYSKCQSGGRKSGGRKSSI